MYHPTPGNSRAVRSPYQSTPCSRIGDPREELVARKRELLGPMKIMQLGPAFWGIGLSERAEIARRDGENLIVEGGGRGRRPPPSSPLLYAALPTSTGWLRAIGPAIASVSLPSPKAPKQSHIPQKRLEGLLTHPHFKTAVKAHERMSGTPPFCFCHSERP